MNTLLNRIRVGSAITVVAMSTLVAGFANAAEDRHVKLFNETRHTITHFYASKISAESWEEDILGDRALKPGEAVNINMDDGSGACLFDFKAVFDDGDSVIKTRINVCEISTYRYTED